MNASMQQVIENCRQQAIFHFRMAMFMKLVGDMKELDSHEEAAKNWSTHTELLCHIENNTGSRYA